ncbi:MAG: ribonuclease P protein component [Sulfurospirillaceae bacterium]|nr:ribonuclease P protein component [Sulfurospirillaceae bacterium]MDD3463368.1 ribonuclease P protein component [Sulfurospirillaceae bacterium]
MGRLKSYETLKDTREYSSIYKNANKWHSVSVLTFCNSVSEKKVGFTASKKVGNAIKRNLAKRRLRAIFLEIQESLDDGIYVFVAKEKISEMTYENLKKEVLWSLRRLNCIKT